MRALSARAILSAWERGAGEPPARFAIDVLRCALPGRSRESLLALPVGRRDALLLALRARTFGDALAGLSTCPACGEALEVAVSTAAILGSTDATGSIDDEASPVTARIEAGGAVAEVRLPAAGDLAALALHVNPDDDAARFLLRRCVLGVEQGGGPVDVDALPAALLERIDAWMAEADPLAELSLSVTCAGCGTSWDAVLDVASILRAEIAARARRLLAEVAALAGAFGWREADILRMSAVRREAYLQQIGAA